ncbi:IGHM protein, partial [Centropus bengalensis]|nr:IGHM protein [Centropus bengalensis]
RSKTTSRLGLPYLEGKSRQPFYCQVEHPNGRVSAEVANPGEVPTFATVTLHPPSREDFDGPFRNSSLLCRVSAPRHLQVRWLKEGTLLHEGITTENLVASGKGPSVVNSRLSVTEADWDAGTTYTCQVENELHNTSKALECG